MFLLKFQLVHMVPFHVLIGSCSWNGFPFGFLVLVVFLNCLLNLDPILESFL